MSTQSTLVITTSAFDDVIARLKQLQSADTPRNGLINNEAVICLQSLEALQIEANKRWGALRMINCSDNLHWIVRAIISAISNKHKKLSIRIERLLLLLDDNTRSDLCQERNLQKPALAQIKQLNDLAVSTLDLEQKIVPALLEIGQIESGLTQPKPHHTLH